MMKSRTLFFAAVTVMSMSFNKGPGLTGAERKYAVDLLLETRADLLKTVAGLTPAQVTFKPDTATWSVAECVEHIATTENTLFSYSQMALKEPADPSKRSEVKMADEAIVRMIVDRSTRVKTQEAVRPTGKFATFEEALNAFTMKRQSNITYIKTTTDDLRHHYNDFPFGKIDAYQTIIFMAGHSKRHTDQIKEIMKHPGFPKR
jgi:hypothetical protein